MLGLDLQLSDGAQGPDTAWFAVAGFARAGENVETAFIVGKVVGEITVQLEEEEHGLVADFAFGEVARRRGSVVEPGL